MASGNRIVVTPEPRGRFEEVIVSGTPKPGTCMELKRGTAAVGGTYTYEPAGTTAASGAIGMSADGDRIPVCVLVCFADHAACPPSKGPTDAYADGERGAVYWPQEGDQINVLFMNQSGTADDVAPGTKGIIDDGTGKVLPSTGAVESEPWNFAETYTDPTADQLVLAVYTGM
jgi:hypothetical protein